MVKWTSPVESMVNFWKNKKVLITGHTGFKGSWLSLWLQHLEANVVGFALSPPTEINLFTLANIGKDMIDLRGDIRDFAALAKVLHLHQPDIVFHLAAQSLVNYSYQHPLETYATNIMGTAHLLEASRQCNSVRAIVNVTTDKCYENNENEKSFCEEDPMGGHDPYSSSKGCSELITKAYFSSFLQKQGIGLASARAGNVIGGGDWATDRLVPDIIRSCMEEKNVMLRFPNSKRPWQHVLEPLSGYLNLALRLYNYPNDYSEGWNFGPDENDTKTVAWVADKLIELWKSSNKWISIEPNNYEATSLKLDCTKVKTKLSWKPKWDITCALNHTVSWYKAYQTSLNMKDISLNQIKNYTEQNYVI